MNRMRAAGSIVAFVLLGVTAARAQTTGSIAGRVDVKTGGGLPLVLVEAKGPSLQGARTATTDSHGRYKLALLPPGAYDVSFVKQGFATETRQGVVVQLDRDTALDIALRATVEEAVTVTSEAPAIDVGSSVIGIALDARAIETIPSGRNYTSIVGIAPGVSSDANPDNQSQTTITVYGSSGAENSYYIDGVNTTGIEYGFQGKELNYEFIEAVDVKTGGYEAEHGKSTGGIINVITKSGSNQFHGDAFGYYDADGLQSSTDSTVSPNGTVTGFTRQDFGFDVGGYFVKDKLWFFVAYDRVNNTTTTRLPDTAPPALIGTEVDSKSKRDLAAAKLTWQVNANHQLQLTYFQDPRDDTGAINDANHTLNGTPTTYAGLQTFGGSDYALRYQGILSPKWIVTAQVARHDEKNSVGPATSAGDAIQYRDVAAGGTQTGGFGLIETKDFSRDIVTFDATANYGRHEIKFGGEYEKESAEVVKRFSGGQQVDVVPNLVNPGLPIYVHSFWTTPTAVLPSPPVSQLNASPEHKDTSLFVQDRWTIRNVTLSFGVRWDRQQIIDASGTTQIDLKKDFAPRIGIVWDPTKDGRTKVFGSFGWFYEQIPMDLVIRSYSYERQPVIVNYDPVSNTADAAAESDYGTPSAILGGFTEPSDPNLKGQYIQEFILGGEREVAKNFVVGAKAIYRSYERVIEDFLCLNGSAYCIGNPGKGIMTNISSFDDPLVTYPAPKPKRVYKALQIDATKRFSHNWQLLASYVWSKLDGNYDGEYSPFTNVGADPNISAAYDYFDFFTDGEDLSKITNRGALSNDRRHQFKVSGYYITPVKLQIGASAYWRTGTPRTRYGYADDYRRYEYFLTQRGTEGRNPSDYEIDLHLGYPLAIKRFTINFLLDVFSLLNAQRPVLLDQRWDFQEADNTSTTPTNPNYGQPILRTRPRAARVGLRFSF